MVRRRPLAPNRSLEPERYGLHFTDVPDDLEYIWPGPSRGRRLIGTVGLWLVGSSGRTIEDGDAEILRARAADP